MKNLITLFFWVLLNTSVQSQCWKIIKSDGSNQTFAIKNDGTLWGWGHNNFGQIGDGTHGDGTNKFIPTKIGTDSNWKTIAVGLYHSVALKTDGTLWTWGLNLTGELGDGTYDYGTEKFTPTQIGTATDWKLVAAGAYHSLAVKNDGSLWAWGLNVDGELGDGTSGFGANKYVPTKIGSATWMSINAGTYHSVGIKSDGTIWAWGSNSYGQLGDGTKISRNIPTQIGITNNWKTLISGGYHTIGIKNDGSLWAWGNNEWGQLGIGVFEYFKLVPTQIGTDTNWQTLAAGGNHTIAIKNNGSLWAWGYNADGEYGNGVYGFNNFAPTQIGTATNWQDVVTGFAHTVFLKTDGSLWTTGENWLGQLGDGTFNRRNTPIQIDCSGLSITEITSKNNSIFTYPNPVKGILYIQKNIDYPIEKISVTDLTGKKVIEQKSDFSKIDVEGLQKGIYTIQLFSVYKNYQGKFVKQ